MILSYLIFSSRLYLGMQMMEAAGFQVEQSSDSLNGSRKENESDKEKEREIESSKSISQSGGEHHR